MKLGCLPYLNVKPLVYSLEHGSLPEGWELVYAPPSKLAQMLADGEIAAAPVSSFACFMNPDFNICPDICIAADGPVKSVLLMSKRPVEEIKTVALDTSSLSGANMLKVLLKESFDLEPEFIRMPPNPVDDMLDSCGAAMVIGDPAMQYPKEGLYILDLAEQWKKLTGLPAVFAVWAGKGITPELIKVLHETKKTGLTKIKEISQQESIRLKLPVEVCDEYLSNIMHYDLGEREMMALRTFRKKAIARGLLNENSGDPGAMLL